MRSALALLASACLITGCASADRGALTLNEKYARLMMLEDERSLGAGEILTRLDDPNSLIRRRATLALGRIGSPEAMLPLVALLSDSDAEIRSTAALALGLLDGPLAPEALSALQDALSDEDPGVRGRAAEALGRKGSSEIAASIAASLRDYSPPGSPPFPWGEDIARSEPKMPHLDQRLGLFALARLSDLPAAWSVLATEQSQPRFLWWPAAWASAQFRADELAPLLLHYAGSNDPYLRLWGARGLGRLSREQAAGPILHLLRDRDEKVRIEAVRATGPLGLREAVPPLLEMLRSDSPYVRVEAVRSLATLPDPVAIDPIIDQISSPSAWLRAAGLRAVAFQDPSTFWLLLAGMDADGDWSVRADLSRLLGQMGGDRAIALLTHLVEDRDYRVRPVALRALAGASPTAARPIVLQHLQAEDPFERAAAADGVRELRLEGAVDPLLAALEASLGDNVPDPGLAILSALEDYGPEALGRGARIALQDRAWLVRKKAAVILTSAGDPTADAGSPDAGLTPEGYLSLVTPAFTPQAFIRTEKGTIEAELFVVDAPLTVGNFIKLAREGFYDGLTFHHVVPNFLVQGGDPRGDGNGGPAYRIRSEVNRRPFLRGTMAMVLPTGKDSAGSQFFITHLPQPQLAGEYTAFGQIIKGMELVDRIEPGDVIQRITIWDGVTDPESPTRSVP
ncbi:MAG: HEAT repeat domain-containing protein [Vicinamibacteria bacterium]